VRCNSVRCGAANRWGVVRCGATACGAVRQTGGVRCGATACGAEVRRSADLYGAGGEEGFEGGVLLRGEALMQEADAVGDRVLERRVLDLREEGRDIVGLPTAA
jgi:hypothetical protein